MRRRHLWNWLLLVLFVLMLAAEAFAVVNLYYLDMLPPAYLMILTGVPHELPKMRPNYAFDTDVENVFVPENTMDMLPPYNATIYTVSGQAVSVQYNVNQVNMNGLNDGMYLIQLEKNGQRVTKKVIR